MLKRVVFIILLIIVLIVVGIFGFSLYGKHQMRKIPDLTFKEALEYTTKDNSNAVITVGRP